MSVEVNSAGTRLVFASGAHALNGTEAGPHLLAVPGDIEPDRIGLLRPEILAGTSPHTDIDVPVVQVFPDDAATFVVRDGSVTIRKDQFFS
jgi:hypothetical protein